MVFEHDEPFNPMRPPAGASGVGVIAGRVDVKKAGGRHLGDDVAMALAM